MKRQTLDVIVSAGGGVIALLLLLLSVILTNQASFARGYVKQQLGEQRITFAAAAELSPEERSWKPGSACLVENAGKPLETGGQAECYANYYIALHMRQAATKAGYGWDNETYATMGGIQKALRADIAAAKEASDAAKAADLQRALDTATSLRTTFQTGETLRGLLLTSFGFSIFGEKAGLAADTAFAMTGLMALLSAAGFVHALLTPRQQRLGSRTEAAGFASQREAA